MKKLSILFLVMTNFAIAGSFDFEVQASRKTKQGSYTGHDDLEAAKIQATQKAKKICSGEIEQLSRWESHREKKLIPGVFGGPQKEQYFVVVKALFHCEQTAANANSL